MNVSVHLVWKLFPPKFTSINPNPSSSHSTTVTVDCFNNRGMNLIIWRTPVISIGVFLWFHQDINKLPSEETRSSNGNELSKEIENENGVFSQNREKPKSGNTSARDGEAETPSVGMIFSSFEETHDFYRNYASKQGFRIFKRSTKCYVDGNIKYFTLACSHAGKPVRIGKSRSLLNPSAKIDCKARISFRVCHDGMFYLTRFISEHNHELSPETRVESDDEVETQVNNNFQLLASNKIVSSGEGNMGNIFNYFIYMKKQDPKFFCDSNTNEDRSIMNVFWADGRSRALYESFGDVISFESTYLNNRYKLPLVSFIGINHHGQSILLGCGLLFLNDKESYVWLFRSWLKCMSGRPPKGIVTDPFPSIEEAVSEVFPEVRHRFCVKHIMKTISSKLCGLPDYLKIKNALKNSVFGSFTIREFEENWGSSIEEFKLENHDWLTTFYLDRARWVPVFVKRTFWAGLAGTEPNKNENVKRFFDGYVQPETTLEQFMEGYNTFIRSKIEKEEHADFMSSSSIIPLITYFPFEKTFQEAYTNEMFTLFQEELRGLMYCNTAVLKTKGPIFNFQVKDFVKKKDGSRRKVVYEVRFNNHLAHVWCECRLFEFCGILCRHAVAVLFNRDVKEVPSRYILSRWRTDINRKHKEVNIFSEAMKTCEKKARFGELHNICRCVAEIGAKSEESFDFAMKLLDETKETMLKRKSENSGSIQEPSSSLLKYSSSGQPLMKKPKGCEPCERTLLRKGWRLERPSQMVGPSSTKDLDLGSAQ